MTTPPIEFVHRGQVVSLRNVPPTRTLLELLREDLHLSATKEGCGEGDCGACTVVLGEARDGGIQYRAINACIRLVHSIHGMALWTAQDLVADDGTLHPVQEAMVQCHASQCGFCTPGFVMSLFGVYQNQVCQGQTVTREAAQHALSGNLCRCTGYRPILQAAQTMAKLPPVRIDEAKVLQKLERISHNQRGLETASTYLAPRTLTQLLSLRAQHPKAQIVAGCTDVGLWITKQHRNFAQLLDITRVQELQRVERYPHHIAIGAAVTLADAFDALVQDRPQLRTFASRFAGLPVRNSGTLGGNVANGSPIGDSMPLLIALGANVVLMSQHGHREMALEQLYTGYRQNVMAPDEVLAWIKVPRPVAGEFSRVYKISKRFEDDISAVCLGLNLHIKDGKVRQASIGVGGVAATPVRALRTQAALRGQPWSQATVRRAMATLRSEFAPISDMRASAAYRIEVLGNLLQRFWLESQGAVALSLESPDVEALTS
ncbi:MAG: xanthine dehydrogenase small subunit [Rhodoferax sp.]|nr:xanthine dehydrogenase small subunit [Rhodoferax sp.]